MPSVNSEFSESKRKAETSSKPDTMSNGRLPKRQKTEAASNGIMTRTNGTTARSEMEKEDKNGSRVEQVCQKCEETGAEITCNGGCLQSFHSKCLGVALPIPKQYTCNECSAGVRPCFSCKSIEGEVKKCNFNGCGKYYHSECLEKFKMADKEKFVCPLHVCLSCYNDNPKSPRLYKCRFVKCIRCPTVYHNRDGCIAAGSFSISQSTIICPEHFVPSKTKPYQSIINTFWCLICASGGNLICCESCPASFHLDCLDDNIEPPEGKYYCNECISRKHSCIGTIVWVKIGCFRWWPARILNPKDVPSNIKSIKHSVGEFPIRYFGTGEYFWTHRGRVFPYTDGDDVGSKEDSKKHAKRVSMLEKRYHLSLKEAGEAYQKWAEDKLIEGADKEKPPAYKHVKTNKPVGKVQILVSDASEHVTCSCDPNSENPCGPDSDCLNHTMLVECHPSVCKVGERCQNQKFQKRESPKLIPFRTRNRGWALKTLEDVKAGQFVIEYVGDLIDDEECKRRLAEKQKNDDHNYYYLTLDKDRIIDAGPKGNYSRFMNHSCDPNCETQKWIVNGDVRIGLFAKKDIHANSEVNFDYMLDSLDNDKLKCFCESQNCRGAIGEKAANTTVKNEPKPAIKPEKKAKRKKTNLQAKTKNEDQCYLCEDGGELVLCGRKGCSKGYHVPCLKLKEIPSGRWQCPWHYCDICGRLAHYLCTRCPNSFCLKHKTDENMTSETRAWVCDEHGEDNDDDNKKTSKAATGISMENSELQNGHTELVD